MRGPACACLLLWKVGLHIQSENQRVFVCAEPSLFSKHLFDVFLGSEIGEIDSGSPSWGLQRSSAQAEQSVPPKQTTAGNGNWHKDQKNLVNVAKGQYLDAWHQSLTSSLVFLAKELEGTRCFRGLAL